MVTEVVRRPDGLSKGTRQSRWHEPGGGCKIQTSRALRAVLRSLGFLSRTLGSHRGVMSKGGTGSRDGRGIETTRKRLGEGIHFPVLSVGLQIRSVDNTEGTRWEYMDGK